MTDYSNEEGFGVVFRGILKGMKQQGRTQVKRHVIHRFDPHRIFWKHTMKFLTFMDVIPKDLKSGEIDGGAYQTTPGCKIHPDLYIGIVPDNDALWTATSSGVWFDHPTAVKCQGCWKEIELVNGRVPDHEPGPAPFSQCPMCGREYEGGVSLYTQTICNMCALDTDQKAYLEGHGTLEGHVVLDGVNDWASGNPYAPPPDQRQRRIDAKERWGWSHWIEAYDHPERYTTSPFDHETFNDGDWGIPL